MERANATHYHEFFPAALVIYRDDETKGISMNVLFSGNSLHSLAATVNLISNFELQLLTNGNNRIKTTNAPMHRYGTKSDESPLSIANISPFFPPHRNQTKINKADLDVYLCLCRWQCSFTFCFTFQCHSMRSVLNSRRCSQFHHLFIGHPFFYLTP